MAVIFVQTCGTVLQSFNNSVFALTKTVAFIMSDENCSPETAAQNAIVSANATGVLIMIKSGGELPILGQGDLILTSSTFTLVGTFEDTGLWDGNDQHGFCSAIPNDVKLLEALKESDVSFSYQTISRPGAFVGLDHLGRWQEMGAPINPTMVGFDFDSMLNANVR